MALSNPGIVMALHALFGNIKPALDLMSALGPTDFSAGEPGVDIKPNTTIKFPLSVVSAALAFDEDTNNYLTGGNTDWASLTATHYLQGYDLKGENIDAGVNAARIKQLFTARAGTGISMSAVNAVKSALDGTTASTGVTLPASPTLAQYDELASAKDWFDPANAALCVNGAELSKLKGVFHGAHLSATRESMAEELGFRKVVLVPGMTARACIVPYSSMGFIARVPAIIAKYIAAGTVTDPDSGLSMGIVVADDQKNNRIVANADLWFGVAALSANADATTKGIIKVVTSA